MRTQLILSILLAVPTIGCGSLYGNYDDAEYDDGYAVESDQGYAEDAVVEDEGAYEVGEDVTSVDVFYDALDEDGVWQQDEEYGYVFAPYADDYVPYTDGYWVETEYGLTWVATDAIGWAVCHYGRWIYRDRWLWVPDTVWGPAWVDWRMGGGWVGWAPLGYGSYSVPYYSWRFVSDDYLYSRNLRSYYRRVHDIRHIYPRTNRVDRYIRGRNGRRYVAGPAHVGGRHAARPRARLRDLPARGTGRHARAERDRRRGSEGRRPGYRASRAHSERMSRAGLAPSRRATTPQATRRTYRTPTRRYRTPSRQRYTSPRHGDRPTRRYDARRRTPTPRATSPRGSRRGTATPNRSNRRSRWNSPTRSPRAPRYRGGSSRRSQPSAGSSRGNSRSKARSDSRRGSSRARSHRGGSSRGHSRGHSRGRRGR